MSKRMLAEAKSRTTDNSIIEYRLCGIEEYEYPESTWDLVISNLALHYIEDISSVFMNVYKTLRSDGVFLFNIEHPVFTAGVNEDWVYDEDGAPRFWPVDDYFMPGRRVTNFLGCSVVKYHHTLTQIISGLLNAGFTVDAVEEAEPPEEMMDIPGMKDELRRPMMPVSYTHLDVYKRQLAHRSRKQLLRILQPSCFLSVMQHIFDAVF